MNIIKGNSNLYELIVKNACNAYEFYGYKYGHIIDAILDKLVVYGIDDRDESIKSIIKDTNDESNTFKDLKYLINHEKGLLNDGVIISYNNLEYKILFRDNNSPESKFNLIKKIFVNCVSTSQNVEININDRHLVRNGFMFADIDTGITYGSSFNAEFTNILARYIYYGKKLDSSNKVANKICQYIFEHESKLGNRQQLIDSYLSSDPYIWDICQNFFDISYCLDRMDFHREFGYTESLEQQLLLYKRMRSK